MVDRLNRLAGSSLVDPYEPLNVSDELIDDWRFFDTLIRTNIEEKLRYLSNWSHGLNDHQMECVRFWTGKKVWERLHDNLRDAVSGLFKSDNIGLRASDSGFICSFIGKNTKKLLKTYLRAIRYTEIEPFPGGHEPIQRAHVDNMDCIYAWKYTLVDELIEQLNQLSAYRLYAGKDWWFPGNIDITTAVDTFNHNPTGKFIETEMPRLRTFLGSICHKTVRFIRKGDLVSSRMDNEISSRMDNETWRSLENIMHRLLMDRIALPDAQADRQFTLMAYEKLVRGDVWSTPNNLKYDTIREVMRLVRESAIQAVYLIRTTMS